MKKVLLLAILIMSCFIYASAKDMQDVVYLKNGSIIRGSVIEQVPNESLKIKTSDGSIFVYKMNEVSKITKEQSESDDESSDDQYAKKWGFNIDGGYMLGIGDASGANSVLTRVGVFRRMNSQFSIGLNSGVDISTNGGDPTIPIIITSRALFPSGSNVLPFVDVNTGYNIPTGGGDGEFEIGAGGGIILPFSKHAAIRLGLGYTQFFYSGGNSGAIYAKIGFDFYGGNPLKPLAPSKPDGLQLTLEGGFSGSTKDINETEHTFMGPVSSLTCTYKYDSHLSFGIGAGYESAQCSPDGYYYNYRVHALKLFGRGVYKFIDHAIMPFVSCDFGAEHLSCKEYNDSYQDEKYKKLYNDEAAQNNGFGLFVAPALGFEFRLAPDTYFDIKLGYNFCTKKLYKYELSSTSTTDNPQYEKYTEYEYRGSDGNTLGHDINSLFLSIGFTQTFGWLSGLFK
jgi:hypothetical protein